MTATPSGAGGSEFWDKHGVKVILGSGTGLYNLNNMVASRAKQRHREHKRESRRVQDLNQRRLNPMQYVLYSSRDRLSPETIKQGLTAWGRVYGETDFSDSTAFDVVEKWIPRDNFAGRHLGQKRKQTSLEIYKKIDEMDRKEGVGPAEVSHLPLVQKQHQNRVVTVEQPEGEGKEVGSCLSICPGITLDDASQMIRLCKNQSVNSSKRGYNPAKESNTIENELYVGEPTPLETYNCGYSESNNLDFVGSLFISLVFVGAATVMAYFIPRGLDTLFSNREKQRGQTFSEMEETSSVFEGKEDEQQLSLRGKGADACNSILQVLIAFKNQSITQETAISLLKDYHFKTEEEAFELLKGS